MVLRVMVLCLSLAVPAWADEAAEKPLRESVQRLARAWNEADAALWVAEYWPDADFINILGMLLPSPAALQERAAAILVGPFKGSRFEGTVRQIRFLGPDAAIVDVDVRVTRFPGLPPGAVATEPGLLATRLKHVFHRRGGIWKIVASQNTAVAPVVKQGPAPASSK